MFKDIMSCDVGLFYDEPRLIKFIVSNLEAAVAGVRCVGSACLVRLRRGTKIYRRFWEPKLPSSG